MAQKFNDRIGKREEITDLMSLEARKHYDIEVGKLLKFRKDNEIVAIVVTRMTKTRMWGVHVEVNDRQVVHSHRGHAVDTTEDTVREYKAPYCTDCEVPVTEPSTEDGEVKAAERRDRTLEDGTVIA
jgi:hypothetical protein